MSERDTHIDEIQRLLDSGEVQQTKRPRSRRTPEQARDRKIILDSRTEEIRKRLEEAARTIIANYEKEVRALQPEVLEKVRDLINPWWNELNKSGLLESLTRFRDGKLAKTFSLNDPIEYFRPASLYAEIKAEKPFSSHTGRVLTRWFDGKTRYSRSEADRKIDPEEALLDELERFTKEDWTSKIYLPNQRTRYLEFSGLEIFSWPSEDLRHSWKFYRGMYGGWKRVDEPTDERRERIQLALGKEEISPPNINPTVLIGFANQIESGKIWGRIEEALKKG